MNSKAGNDRISIAVSATTRAHAEAVPKAYSCQDQHKQAWELLVIYYTPKAQCKRLTI
jgi:hypothetical protein